jgi:hypothetical protein
MAQLASGAPALLAVMVMGERGQQGGRQQARPTSGQRRAFGDMQDSLETRGIRIS